MELLFFFFSTSFHPCLQRNSLRKTNHCLQNGSLRSSQGGTSREKREVSDICLFKEKQKGGVTLKMNRLTERERERERWALRNHFTMSRQTHTGESQMVCIGYILVCVCVFVFVFFFFSLASRRKCAENTDVTLLCVTLCIPLKDGSVFRLFSSVTICKALHSLHTCAHMGLINYRSQLWLAFAVKSSKWKQYSSCPHPLTHTRASIHSL